MIIAKLSDGLGNQMFQYAHGLALARRFGQVLKLDISIFDAPGYQPEIRRRFRLDAFDLRYALVDPAEAAWFYTRPGRWVNRWHVRLVERGMRPLGKVMLRDYYQGERFFSEIAGQVRESFAFKSLRGEKANQLARAIDAAGNSLSVHVRLTDYVGHALHDVCGRDYYREAIRHVLARSGGGAAIFVFSDAVESCAWLLDDFPGARLVDREIPDVDALQLMSRCRHHVIANSSFSWWGAWLGERPGALVVGPDTWFNDPVLNERFLVRNGLIPARWHRVAVAGA